MNDDGPALGPLDNWGPGPAPVECRGAVIRRPRHGDEIRITDGQREIRIQCYCSSPRKGHAGQWKLRIDAPLTFEVVFLEAQRKESAHGPVR